MISFLQNPSITLILSEKEVKLLKKSKDKDNETQKRVKFSKNEVDLLKKLEKTDVKNYEEKIEANDEKKDNKKTIALSLDEVKQLQKRLEAENKFLCDLIENEQAHLELPKNPEVERNPELEKRIQKLKAQQANKQYESMVRNVDTRLKQTDPQDSIAYQIKQINRQLIAVLQFVFSVISGFFFGFLGIELLIGSLDFGFRLLLGIICALVIALAEIYFLAKQLIEEEDALENSKKLPPTAAEPSSSTSPVKTNDKLKTN